MKTFLTFIALLILLPGDGFLRSSFAGESSSRETRKILFYQDSMHPWVKSDRPGRCPICTMNLTPIYEGDPVADLADDLVALTPNNITVLNVQTEVVKRQNLRRTLRVAGTLDANDVKKTVISAPAAGRVEDTAVNYAGVEVRQGERLLTFYSPDLTQQKYRYLVRAQRAPDQRDPSGGIAWMKGNSDPYYTDLVAPLSGTVLERNVTKGRYVAEGEPLFTIADASVLWFRFDVYEQQLPWLRVGQTVKVSLPAIPGETFEAVISFINPMLDLTERTVKVRADLANPMVEQDGTRQRRFKFGMYADGVVLAEVPDRLVVPRAAVLYPGDEAYVYVDQGDGVYQRRVIELGRQGDEFCEIRAGLKEGERVISSGNVLVDAQAQFTHRRDTPVAESKAPVLSLAPPPDSPPRPNVVVNETAEPTADTPPLKEEIKPEAPGGTVEAPSVSPARIPSVQTGGLRGRPNTRMSKPDPIPTGGRRSLENAMYVRMAEMRNEEMAEARAVKTGLATNGVEYPRDELPIGTATAEVMK